MSDMETIRENYADYLTEHLHNRATIVIVEQEAHETFDEMIRQVREQAWDQGMLAGDQNAHGAGIENPFRPRDIDMTANQRAAEGLI